jgi:single-strand DNA-binding protein
MNSIQVAGNISQDAEIKTLGNGDQVCNFSVADNQGGSKGAIFWRCAIFGKRATSLSAYLTKGQPVTVTGTLEEKEWTNRDGVVVKQFNMRVNDVALQGKATGKSESRQQTQQSDDLNDTIPF